MGIIPTFPNPERRNFNFEASQRFDLNEASSRASKVLEAGSVKLEDFTDLYSLETVTKDQRYVATMLKKFEKEAGPQVKEAKQLATILEATIYTQVNNSQWFGPRAKAIKSSEYDDIVNGVDSIIEFSNSRQSPNYVAMAVDVTYRNSLSIKFDRIKEEIDSGELSTIKYLKSSDGSFRGERKFVPHLVVGVDHETSHALAKSWFARADGLKNNPIRLQILREMQIQLQAFERYARKNGKLQLADKFAESKNIIDLLVSDVEKQSPNSKFITADKAYMEMEKELLKFS
jgi:hypothetical protein